MAKRKQTPEEEKSMVDAYRLHSAAVDDLVAALHEAEEENGEKEPEKKPSKKEKKRRGEPDPYKIDRFSKIPLWVKACFFKFWTAGAIYYFFGFGLGTVISNQGDLLLVLILAQGIITDILLNNAFRHFQSPDREFDKYMMFPMKKYWTFFANIAYAAVLVLAVSYLYQGINAAIIAIWHLDETKVPLGVEPLLFGLFYLGIDLIFLSVRNAIRAAIGKRKLNPGE